MRNNHDIAIELENIVLKEFGFKARARGTIFDADQIELRMFFDIIHLMLYIKSKDDYSTFLDSIYEYQGLNMRDIPDCESIFEGFFKLIKHD